MQDVFLKVWAKRDTLIGIRAFDSYLFRMARNRIFDLSRQSQLRLKIVREAGRQPQTSADSPYEGLLFQEYYRVAQQAINRLPTRRKQIFLMNARDELTAREIADKLGMTRLAVKKQLYEASHFIKDELRKNADLFLLFLFFLK